MQQMIYYTIMPDGTVKQVNPFTGTEVWAVGGRRNRPVSNGTAQEPKSIEKHEPEDYCSFCDSRYFEVPPEKSRLVRRGDSWERIHFLAPDRYLETVAEFRRVGNLFEIVSLEYWRRNYAYKMTHSRQRCKEDYLANPKGLAHITDIVRYKLRQEERTDEQIDKMALQKEI